MQWQSLAILHLAILHDRPRSLLRSLRKGSLSPNSKTSNPVMHSPNK